MNLCEYQKSRSFIDLGPRSLRFKHFQTTARPIEAKFHMEPPWDWGMKVNTNGLCHINKMQPCSYLVKTFKNRLLCNQKADDRETWYAALVN